MFTDTLTDCLCRVGSIEEGWTESQLVVEWIFNGTNTVGWPNIPANNGKFNLKGVSVMEIEDGKIKHNREYWDLQTFTRAVGAN